MEFNPIEELMLELSLDGVRKDKNTVEFVSPDGLITTTLKLNEYNQTITLETKLMHGFSQLEGLVYSFAEELYNRYTDQVVRDIIEDIATQIKYILFPELFNNLERFELKDSMEHESTFECLIDYKDKPYEEIKEEVYSAIDDSFKMITQIHKQVQSFIEENINKYLQNPEIELKLLEIKKRLFQVQFYLSMTGRFAEEQKHKAKRIYREAINLYEKFKADYPEEYRKYSELMDLLFGLFSL